MAEVLKPCPFCGGRGARVDVTWEYEMINEEIFTDRRFYVIECFTCHARTHAFLTEEEALNAWDKRVDE